MLLPFIPNCGTQNGHFRRFIQFIGISRLSHIKQSIQWITRVGPEGQTGKLIHYVADIPIKFMENRSFRTMCYSNITAIRETAHDEIGVGWGGRCSWGRYRSVSSKTITG